MFPKCSTQGLPRFAAVHIDGAWTVEHDLRLRAAAREIYDAVYPSEEWSPTTFDEAERFGTVHYRQAVSAAQKAKGVLTDPSIQPELFASRQS